ncbi:alpha-ketoglutarate-dependent dioxygenase AlkB family protein [Thalassotalea algicola]|uniref:alpha-ketoglutarate-dependent dioxygenase AlkB family protein n=1 Tax=Thalassotalea algicola TaxID=2716224 RepID=UPI002E29BAC7|nr:alpha-ketoglutarate-dependent dioxygenase AlkB [Thalassotalea algicola]
MSASNAHLNFEPNFLSSSQARQLFDTLQSSLNWRQDEIYVYGRAVAIPRLQAWYGDSGQEYQYSGLKMTAMPWTKELVDIKAKIEAVTGCQFNSCLANLYRDGSDTVGWHSDDEPELGAQPVIASLSLGETRNFQLKHKTLKEKLTIPLNSGSLLVMAGETQHAWQHCLPRTKRLKSPRINLTFRKIIG